MAVDPSLVQFYSGFNAYKNTGVKSGFVTVSGTLANGTIGTYDKAITLDEAADYFTLLVKTSSATGGVVRWQAMPSSAYYDVPCTGPSSSFAVLLAVLVNGTSLTLRAWTLNNSASTITWTTTNIEFKYVPYTLAN